MYLSKARKEEIKTQGITELFKDKRLKETIHYVCIKHRIPLEADIQSEILMVVMENMVKYDTNKFVEAYTDKKKPDRILKLAKKMVLWKGVYIDKRCKKYWQHSIAQQIMFQSNLNTLEHVDSCDDTTNDYNLPQTAQEDNVEEIEQDNSQMWDYVRKNLTNEENAILYLCLQPHTQPKMKGKLKKNYQNLLLKLKVIITEFKNNN